MKVKPFRIPKQVVLPGLLVAVHQVDPLDPVLEGADGSWDYDETNAVISIDRRLTIQRKRYILIHELSHVVADYMHDVHDNHKKVVGK